MTKWSSKWSSNSIVIIIVIIIIRIIIIIVMIFIFIKILVHDSEMGEDFLNRFFWGELKLFIILFLLLLLLLLLSLIRIFNVSHVHPIYVFLMAESDEDPRSKYIPDSREFLRFFLRFYF